MKYYLVRCRNNNHVWLLGEDDDDLCPLFVLSHMRPGNGWYPRRAPRTARLDRTACSNLYEAVKEGFCIRVRFQWDLVSRELSEAEATMILYEAAS